MSQSQSDIPSEMDKLIKILDSDRRVSYLLSSVPNNFAAQPTFGTAVDLLLDYFNTGREIPHGRLQRLTPGGNVRNEQEIRDAIESQVERIQQIPQALFSLIFHIDGETIVNFRFGGYSREVAARILGEDLGNAIKDYWCEVCYPGVDRDPFELAAGSIRPHRINH